ncbi:MAG: polyphosphate kinase 1, partial [Gammaproteobacteria bacterium]|nr:polyphosphate kinase 1 [Gammaproteobacteria bacterium]
MTIKLLEFMTEIEAEQPDLTNPDLYTNRELSLIEFHKRVLAQAQDANNPLLERLRFLCIASTNLDEFFEIRLAGVKQKVKMGITSTGPDKISSADLLGLIRPKILDLVNDQYEVLNEELLPALAELNIRFIRRGEWSKTQEKWLHEFFIESLLPVLSPIGLDIAHPFPRIQNKSLCFILSLKGKDAFGRDSGKAVIQAPMSLPEVIQLPPGEDDNGPNDYVFLSSIIHAYVDELFHGMKVVGMYQFRLTRNSDLIFDEDEVDDLINAMEGQLLSRRYGDVVRLEVDKECPQELIDYLLKTLDISADDIYLCNGPVNVNRFVSVCDMDGHSELKYPPYAPKVPSKFSGSPDYFKILDRGDVLLHHPFESFSPFIDFLLYAAKDNNVLAIKQTLYRTGWNSQVVDALVLAAQRGKEVTVVIEIRARFDEADNINLADRLQRAGVQVVYGVVGFKTHVKMAMVVRRDGKQLRRYVHLGTGNYHQKTTKVYTDYGLFTSDKAIGEDVHSVFMQLTSLGKVAKMNKLIQSPFAMHKFMLDKIEREAINARQGKPARIIAKMNSLIEPKVIEALYAASIAGVKIDLIIRGMCRLRPGIPGISENIQVRSIVGRYLEHTRAMYFHNNGDPYVMCSSADWMERNFFQRVEICFPVESKKLSTQITEQMKCYLADNTHAWEQQSDGSYTKVEIAEGEEAFSVQDALMENLRCRVMDSI